MADLSTIVGGVKLDGFVMNASGPYSTELAELKNVADSDVAAIVTKSTTFVPRAGNAKPRYIEFADHSINAHGLPNPGYLETANRVNQLADYTDKPIILSYVAFNLAEALDMTRALNDSEAAALELNLSCPNLAGTSVLAFDEVETRAFVTAVKGVVTKPLWLKLPPYLDGVQQTVFAQLFAELKPDALVTINSIGNTVHLNPDTMQVGIKPVWGGLGGPTLKPVTLGNLLRFWRLYHPSNPSTVTLPYKDKLGPSPTFPDLVGVGGVGRGVDAFEMALCGARAVQVGTAYAVHGLGVFKQINRELSDVLDKHGFDSVSEAVGKARERDKADNEKFATM